MEAAVHSSGQTDLSIRLPLMGGAMAAGVWLVSSQMVIGQMVLPQAVLSLSVVVPLAVLGAVLFAVALIRAHTTRWPGAIHVMALTLAGVLDAPFLLLAHRIPGY